MIHPNFSRHLAGFLKAMQAGIVLQLYGGCMEVAMTNYAPIVFIPRRRALFIVLKKNIETGTMTRRRKE